MRTPVDPKYFSSAEIIASANKPFKVRAALLKALVPLLEQESSKFLYSISQGSIQEVLQHQPALLKDIAQELVFLVEVRSGWGPHQNDIEKMANTLKTGFFAFCDAFAEADFPNPQSAALRAMKELGLNI